MVIESSTKHNICVHHQLHIDGIILNRATSCKFLGITLDEFLSRKQPLSTVNSKISRALFTIKQVKFTLTKETVRILYFSLLHPHLIYGILAWGNATFNSLRKTELLQKRAIRTIHNTKFNSHTDPLFKHSGILKLSDLYQLEVMLFMHDYSHNKLPKSFKNFYHINRDVRGTYDTRQSYMYYIPSTKSRFVDKLPFFQFPTIWNSWYAKLNVQVSHYYLKRSIQNNYLSKYATVVHCDNQRCTDCHNVS